jgi:hypothetical protein
MKNAIQLLIQLEQQMRVLHWQTKSYARHNAYGQIYDALSDLIDKFAEVGMGKYGRFEVDSISIKNLDDLQLESYLDMMIKGLAAFNQEFSADSDLLNLRDEILAEINKLKYLLTLK